MTVDQVLMLLTDRKLLNRRTRSESTLALASKARKDGLYPGRDADGNPMLARIGGKSKARQLMEAENRKRGQ